MRVPPLQVNRRNWNLMGFRYPTTPMKGRCLVRKPKFWIWSDLDENRYTEPFFGMLMITNLKSDFQNCLAFVSLPKIMVYFPRYSKILLNFVWGAIEREKIYRWIFTNWISIINVFIEHFYLFIYWTAKLWQNKYIHSKRNNNKNWNSIIIPKIN